MKGQNGDRAKNAWKQKKEREDKGGGGGETAADVNLVWDLPFKI